MSAEKLAETLERLRADALAGVSESRHDRRLTEEENETRERYQLILDTCDELVGALDPRAGESA